MRAIMSTTIRVSEKTRATVHDLARKVGVPMAEVVERGIEQYRRQCFVEAINAGYAELRADPELRRRAQENTERMLEGMMRGLGFERVTVTFKAPPV